MFSPSNVKNEYFEYKQLGVIQHSKLVRPFMKPNTNYFNYIHTHETEWQQDWASSEKMCNI